MRAARLDVRRGLRRGLRIGARRPLRPAMRRDLRPAARRSRLNSVVIPYNGRRRTFAAKFKKTTSFLRRTGLFEGRCGRDVVKSFKIQQYYNKNVVIIGFFAKNYVIGRFYRLRKGGFRQKCCKKRRYRPFITTCGSTSLRYGCPRRLRRRGGLRDVACFAFSVAKSQRFLLFSSILRS